MQCEATAFVFERLWYVTMWMIEVSRFDSCHFERLNTYLPILHLMIQVLWKTHHPVIKCRKSCLLVVIFFDVVNLLQELKFHAIFVCWRSWRKDRRVWAMAQWAGVWRMTRTWHWHGGRAWSSALQEYVFLPFTLVCLCDLQFMDSYSVCSDGDINGCRVVVYSHT